MIKAVIFDFDGVILESVDVKGWAFQELFKGYPQYQQAILDFHLANGGMPRFDKFRYIYKEMLKKPLSDEEFEFLCQEFSRLVFDRVLSCPYVPGAKEFLENVNEDVRCFIVSGTPQEEIERVVRAKELDRYFEKVYGSPNTKNFWTKKILDDYALDNEQVLWIGDAQSDLQAAEEFDIKFVGRITKDNEGFVDHDIYARMEDLHDLDKLLDEDQIFQ